MNINVKHKDSGTFQLTETGDWVCAHVDAYIERACCSGFDAGLPSCACHGQDGILCPNWFCTGIEEHEAEELFEVLDAY